MLLTQCFSRPRQPRRMETCFMDLHERQTEWWDSLSSPLRYDVAHVEDAVPDWMVESLADHGINCVEADLTGHSRVFLMTTHLRDFVSQHAVEAEE